MWVSQYSTLFVAVMVMFGGCVYWWDVGIVVRFVRVCVVLDSVVCFGVVCCG